MTDKRPQALLGLLLALAMPRCDCGGLIGPIPDGAEWTTDAVSDAAAGDVATVDSNGLDAGNPDRAGADVSGEADRDSTDAVAGDAASDATRGDVPVADATTGTDSAGALDTGNARDSGGDSDASAGVDGRIGGDGNGAPDSGAVDAATGNDSGLPTGLTTPCQNGSGWTLLRFHYDGSYSARIDVWDATCAYSLADQACNVTPVLTETLIDSGYALLVSTNSYIRARFSANGLAFDHATLYVEGRSYSTGSSTTIEAWSPLYGSAYSGLVSNAWEYHWYAIDWTGYLYPDDDPHLTAFQLYAYQGSGSLAVHAVELCVE